MLGGRATPSLKMTGGGAGSAAPLAAALAALMGVAGACGGGPRRETGEPPATAATVSGRTVFLSQCQGCHSVGGLGASRPVGGDLAKYSMTPREVVSYARVMPTPRRLTRRELAAVGGFVSRAQRRSGRGSGRGRASAPRGSSAQAEQTGGAGR